MLNRYRKDSVFMEKIEPIISSEPFLRLKETKHHNDSIYDHTLRVTYKAYRTGKLLKADEAALLRGALFHDLYFHNWRDKEYIFNHGWTHPVIALKNARELYPPVTEKEANIISSHMWPFNVKNPPRSKEALIVAFADKWVATGEVILMFLGPLFRFPGTVFKKVKGLFKGK